MLLKRLNALDECQLWVRIKPKRYSYATELSRSLPPQVPQFGLNLSHFEPVHDLDQLILEVNT